MADITFKVMQAIDRPIHINGNSYTGLGFMNVADPNYSITFNTNGGSISKSGGTTINSLLNVNGNLVFRYAGVPQVAVGDTILEYKLDINNTVYDMKEKVESCHNFDYDNPISKWYNQIYGETYRNETRVSSGNDLGYGETSGLAFYYDADNNNLYACVFSRFPDKTSDWGQAWLIPGEYNSFTGLDPNPYSTEEPNDTGEGGYGDFNYESDDDDIPDLPTLSVTDAGFANLFKLDAQGVKDLANYLWSGLFDISTYLKLFSDPMDCILSLAIVPFDPPADFTMYIVVGNHATTIQAPRVSDQWFELDCGSIEVNGGDYSNSFMDYSPYTSAQLYLPYVGTVALDIDEIMDSTINVVYHIDLFSGSCVAYVKVTKDYEYKGGSHTHSNVLYQYSGNVLTNIPITSQNFTQVFQAVIGAVATGVSGGAAGAGVATGAGEAAAASGEGAAIATAMQLKPPVHRSGNCSSACGLLGTQKPKLMLTLPKLVNPADMNKERGLPSYMRKTLSDLAGSGYTKIDLAHIKGIPCTDQERDEIIRLLESGVEL